MVRNWVKLIESERVPEGVVSRRERREGVGVWPVGELGTGHEAGAGGRMRRGGQGRTSNRGRAWPESEDDEDDT
jgi:hypothetical protein